LKNVRYAKGSPLEDKRVVKAIDAGKAKLGECGRLVIRPSGTEPVIRVMAESDDAGEVETVVDAICEAVKEAAGG
jgi:phosphoglucosamine mutase